MRYDWFKWYPAIYKAATMELTPHQDGCYRRLIDFYMETGKPIPRSMTAMARIVGISEPDFNEVWIALEQKFDSQPDGFHLSICDEQLQAQEVLHSKLSSGGKKAHSSQAPAQPQPSPEPTPQPLPQQIREEKKKEESIPPIAPPLTDEVQNVSKTIPAKPEPKPRGTKLQDWLSANGYADDPDLPKVPGDWIEWADKKHGWDDETIAHVAGGFFRYFTGPDAKSPVKIDWKRAFQTWCDRAIGEAQTFVRSRKGPQGGQKAGYSSSVADSSEKAKQMLDAQPNHAEDPIPHFD